MLQNYRIKIIDNNIKISIFDNKCQIAIYKDKYVIMNAHDEAYKNIEKNSVTTSDSDSNLTIEETNKSFWKWLLQWQQVNNTIDFSKMDTTETTYEMIDPPLKPNKIE